MKSIRELRMTLSFHPEPINSSISFFAEHATIDFDVYLPSKKMNLQRDFVWDIHQKREIIWSILMNRHIPRMSMINTKNGVYQVIDGKQRLTSMIDFYNNKFYLIIDGESYYYKDLPIDYQRVISGYYFAYNIVNEDYDNVITDEQKISWFKYLNFAGTAHELSHLISLS